MPASNNTSPVHEAASVPIQKSTSVSASDLAAASAASTAAVSDVTTAVVNVESASAPNISAAIIAKDSNDSNRRNFIIAIIVVLSFIVFCILGCLIVDYIHPHQIPYSRLRSEITQSHKYSDYTLKIVNSDVSEYPHVKLYFSLTDSSGKALEIDSPTAAIRETIGGEEVERLIHKVERIKDNQGVNYEILLDKSGSMEYSMDTMKKP